MTSLETDDLVRQGEQIYHQRLRAILEPQYLHKFLAIEPQSGDYFLGDTLSDASAEGRRAHPGRLMYLMRVGHDAAVHLGAVK